MTTISTFPTSSSSERFVLHYRFTGVADGDLRADQPPEQLDARRALVAPGAWTWLRQQHGAEVVVVDEPGAQAGVAADAAVTRVPGAVLCVQVADCAPVVVFDPTGGVGVAHAGWRGLQAGVIAQTVRALRSHGGGQPSSYRAIVGPCIHPECYEFGADDLDALAARFGDGVRGRTRSGTAALDLVAGVTSALRHAGVRDIHTESACTACGTGLWSHRARGDRSRQAGVAWLSADGQR